MEIVQKKKKQQQQQQKNRHSETDTINILVRSPVQNLIPLRCGESLQRHNAHVATHPYSIRQDCVLCCVNTLYI
jgi:hypothetical protein